jgi:thiamine biosynthesis lipoprotein
METVALARHAMATRFEIVLNGNHPVALRAAGEEALAEIERIEAQLSLYRPSSEITRINARAAREPVRVSPGVFALLERASTLSRETGGAFDITIAPLVRCWGFMGEGGLVPGAEALAEARNRVGMRFIQLDPEALTVRFEREGMMLDLGAIGKGYAIERAAELLQDAGIASALLHGGTSTVYALGRAENGEPWKVAIDHPQETASPRLLATVPLENQALSVSAVWGKFFESAGRTYGHVLDPRTGQPADSALLAAVVLSSATESDALSTALLVHGAGGHDPLSTLRPGMRTLLLTKSASGIYAETHGIPLAASP